MRKHSNALKGYGPKPASTKIGPAPRVPDATGAPISPGTPQLNTSAANMSMTAGPLPPTTSISTPEPIKPGAMGPKKGPAPKIAEDTKAYLRRKLRQDEVDLPEPPSLTPPKPPKPPKAFKPKKPPGAFMRSGSSKGTT